MTIFLIKTDCCESYFSYNQNKSKFTNNQHFSRHVALGVAMGLGLWFFSVIMWQSVLLVEETRVPRENHQLVASH
jgi:uncharacterized membrane protein YhiD involved in acid resistance